MTDTVYKEEILEHYKDPQNFGNLEDYTVSSRQINPFCGDDIEMFIKEDKGIVMDIAFRGEGCAISVSAASLLTEEVKGKSLHELKDFSEDDMLDLLGVDISDTRKKCALLAFVVLNDCLK